MKLHKKKVVASLLIVVFLLSLSSGAFANNSFYERVTTERISRGVTQSHIQRFDQNGWLNANVMYVDLMDDTLELDLLQSSGGLTTKETLSTMVSRQKNVVGAINGDFFYMTNPDSPMGVMVKDGRMISSPVINNQLGTLYINNNNNAFAEYLDYTLNLKTDQGKQLRLGAINKLSSRFQLITVIDRNWGTHSPGVASDRPDMVEVVVVNDVVVEVRKALPAVQIPENGYIIMASGVNGGQLANNLNVGDRITIDIQITPGIENLKLAMGGGTLLVSNGQVVPNFTQTNVTGNAPRTAVGVTKDRSKLILVTVDGRNSSWPGLDGTRLARLLIELGSHEAVIMDGGGSTTMITRPLGSYAPRVINTPSDGAERRIINGLAVISNLPQGNIEGLKAVAANQNVFKDTSVEIRVTAYDTNYNPFWVDPTKVSYSVKEGSGTFNSNRFTPNRAGNATIVVEYLGKTTEVSVKVLDEPANLEITPKSITLSQGRTANLSVIGVDPLGYRAPINAGLITWKDTKGLGTVANGVYTAGNNSGQSQLEATYKNGKGTIPVVIGNQQVEVTLDNFNEMKVRFNSFPQEVTGSVTLVNNGRNNSKAVALEYDFTTTDVTRAAYMDYSNGGITINGSPSRIGVWVNASAQSKQWIRGRVFDANGTAHIIDFSKGVDWTGWKYLEATLPSNISYPVRIDRLYVAETNSNEKAKGTLIFDDLQAVYPSNVTVSSSTSNVIKDPLYRPAATKGTVITAHSGIGLQQKSTLLDRYVNNNIIKLINENSNRALFTGEVGAGIRSDIKTPYVSAVAGHTHLEDENSLIIRLDNRKNGLRQTNFQQWPYLKQQLETSKKNNVFIILPNPIWGGKGFSDGLEAELLAEILTKEAEKGRNIFVLYGGEDLQVNLYNGVRYIATGLHQQRPTSPTEAYRYVEFNVLGNEVTYQIRSVFN
ncbi:phosphodiester glycosidase family protein [Alkaliphilus transvaalensis]|uniref:phosphodiester glycosidase family protein n=1 Tax=Alkaliphilus transvaalensis TaxID=114628 RepID=UPI00047C695C|nr:phosphodiester glycosidase family protein [Alkaliphilus transvaalensis]